MLTKLSWTKHDWFDYSSEQVFLNQKVIVLFNNHKMEYKQLLQYIEDSKNLKV